MVNFGDLIRNRRRCICFQCASILAGEIINFNNLIIAIFEFVHSIVDRKRFSNLLDNLLQEVMYYLIIFMQITDDQIELWTTNPNQFVEEDDILTYNVRISAQELLTVIFQKQLKQLIDNE